MSQKRIPQAQINSVANALGVISLYMPGENQDEKLAMARKVAKEIMVNHKKGGIRRASKGVRDILEIESIRAIKEAAGPAYSNPGYPDNSYATTNVSDTAKDVTPPSPGSHYQTKFECVTRSVNEDGLTEEAAEKMCSAFFSDDGNTLLGGSKADVLKRLTDKGFGLAQANAIINKMYGLENKSRVSRSKEIAGSQSGTSKSKHATWLPGNGEIKYNQIDLDLRKDIPNKPLRSASVVEIAPWAVLHGGVNPAETITPERQTRSASISEVKEYTQKSGLQRVMERRNAILEAKQQERNLRNASLEKVKPNWQIAYEHVRGVSY